jgi:serine/threonine-protein kinase
VTETAAAPDVVDSRIPPALSAIVMKCLAKRAVDRYQRGHELADALIGFLSGTGSPEEMRAAWTSRVLSPSRAATTTVG